MHSNILLSALVAAPLAVSAEQVLGVYVFHRHGDRTAKAWAPVNMTALGAEQVFTSGDFYRRRYIDSAAGLRVKGLSATTAVLSQLSVTSPKDAVLHNSASVFLQGLYPPTTANAETLANGTKVSAPLGGYQYVPVDAIDQAASSKKSESNEWLQGGSGCSKAEISSNNYLQSAEYKKVYDETKDFYQSLLPVIQSTYPAEKANFKAGYTIFDYINVARIHNETFPSKDLITGATYDRLYNLASIHEWNLAYNATEPVRAIAGSVLAGQVLNSLQSIVDRKAGVPKLNVQFGAYGTFMAFFGLSQLPAASNDFYGVCDYASSMSFELVTNANDPKPEDISVRFFFSNGTAAEHGFKSYPLFGQDKTTLSWNDFKTGISKFAVADSKSWCDACGSNSGSCSANSTVSTTSSSSGGDNGSVSRPVAGVIGALVTLVVILGIQGAVMLFGGLRLVKKSTLGQVSQAGDAAMSKA